MTVVLHHRHAADGPVSFQLENRGGRGWSQGNPEPWRAGLEEEGEQGARASLSSRQATPARGS